MSDKLPEYFELMGQIKTIMADLKEKLDEHDLSDELSEIKKSMKELKEKMEEDDTIKTLREKVKTLKERQELIKEIILVQMQEAGQEKLEFEGNEILLTQNLKFKKIKK